MSNTFPSAEELLWGKKPKKRTKRKKIPKHVKETVWAKYIGMDKAEGKCYVCQRTIHITTFDVGHNKAHAKGGSDNINNLRPICRGCNLSMGTMSIEAFKRRYFQKTEVPTKKPTPKPKASGTVRCKDCEHLYKEFGVGPYLCSGYGILNIRNVDKSRTWRKCGKFSPTTKTADKYQRRGRGWKYIG